ncbi:MAG TPA: hypothetical protein ENI26_09180 [Methylophaga aminisulfidivorans]|jgi:hypothetical protein|uniref:DUF1845 domain-containing protein n=2 Tax=root TaxID=1 RepID=A0A7C1ZRV4_9GAMM|nr:hypothetical protein [Methylophaga sp.]MBN45292.1 hypothetical protein [Methylophaga sp.]HDY86109.1 hypothetical protein [Methylophaga sp.]HEC74527.1 hypothetical protein [Methylophaga aminisulfidivorans]|tara:strand:+ start:1208 stop:1894 length:687 start_codon:yes stop_codon:yes gene_type:complete
MAEEMGTVDPKRESRQQAEMQKIKQFLTEEEVKSEFYMEMIVTLQSAQAKRIFRRTFEHIQTQMTAATLLTRKFGLRELSDENVRKITESIRHLSTEMNRDMEQADHILNSIGIKNAAVTDDSVDLLIKITCPEGMAFMNLIRQLDNLTMKLKTLWMAGEVPLAHSEDRSHAWQVRIFKIADAIRALGQQAYIASDKKKDSDLNKAQAKRQSYKKRKHNASKQAATTG